MENLQLAQGEVHVWYTYCDAVTDPTLLARYGELLSDDERQRAARFLREPARHQFLVAHALLRTVLSHYAPCDPRDWVFANSAHGKPRIAGPTGSGLGFNLSHTQGLVACAVTGGQDVGIDVEDLHRHRSRLDLARRYFAPAEVAALDQCPAGQRDVLFLQFWTLKEAYVKARGQGLSIPLSRFAFTLAPDRPPSISFAAGHVDDPRAWQFAQVRLSGRFQLALAMALPPSIPLRIHCREGVPLADRGPDLLLPPCATNEWSV